MSKSNPTTLIAIVILIVVVIGGYFIFHKSPKTIKTTTTTTSSQTTVNNSVLVSKTSSSVGPYLTEPNGDTLYTYGGDSSGVSNCTGTCLSSWPAYQDTGATTNLPTNVSTLKRSDNGEIQYTYKGHPLYTFVNDSKGQVTGNGVSDFSVAKP